MLDCNFIWGKIQLHLVNESVIVAMELRAHEMSSWTALLCLSTLEAPCIMVMIIELRWFSELM